MTDWRRIGEGKSQAQNPPALSEENVFCWSWFGLNMRDGFAVQAGLLPSLLAMLDMVPISKQIFVRKLGLITAMFNRLEKREE